jgi:hypothetical protein
MNPDSRRDLDVFCTAYVQRGGMGNHAVEGPGSVLYGTVEDCLQRRTLPGEAREYVYRLLVRAGIEAEEAAGAADHVHDVFHIISEFREVESHGPGELEWARQLPLLEACDPATDLRWKGKVVHKKYENSGAEVWLYASKQELEEAQLDRFWFASAAFPYLHREDGPALILWSQRWDGPWEEYWFRHGERHREDGPAYIMYGGPGEIIEQRYYLHDRQVQPEALNS